MKTKLSNVKTLIVGIQGSGKTELAKHFCNYFKRPMWYLMHLDDVKRMPKKVMIVSAQMQTLAELDGLCAQAIRLGKAKLIDCLVIDEADMFLKAPLPRNVNDLVINHRHYNLAVLFLTRRPQDIPTKIVESCEHTFIFALPNSDNVDRKLGALHRELPDMIRKLSKEKHNFIHIKLGAEPTFMKPIQLKGEQKTKNETTSKKDIADDESRS